MLLLRLLRLLRPELLLLLLLLLLLQGVQRCGSQRRERRFNFPASRYERNHDEIQHGGGLVWRGPARANYSGLVVPGCRLAEFRL